MPTALYSIYATVGLHVTVPRMPVLQLYASLRFLYNERKLHFFLCLCLQFCGKGLREKIGPVIPAQKILVRDMIILCTFQGLKNKKTTRFRPDYLPECVI